MAFMSRRFVFRGLALAALPLLSLACAGDEMELSEGGSGDVAAVSGPITVAGVGFSTPESVLHATDQDVYLVSNINGAPTAADGNGFISRVSPAGEVLDLRWIDGEAEGVTLNAPKGMAIVEGTLYVSDIDCVRMFGAEDGAPAGEVCVEGATFLNDLVAHPEGQGVLLTDTGVDGSFAPAGADALYHVMGGQAAAVVADPGLGGPNGVATSEAGILLVTFSSGQVYRVTGENEYEEILAVEGGQLDGVEILDNGDVLVSNWATSCVHLLDGDGNLSCLIPDLEAPADIGLDRGRNRVLVPLFNANEVRIIPLG